MTPKRLTEARAYLGHRWGLGRPLAASELARAMRIAAADPGQSIRDYESGKTAIPGPVSTCVAMFLAGALPPDGLGVLKP